MVRGYDQEYVRQVAKAPAAGLRTTYRVSGGTLQHGSVQVRFGIRHADSEQVIATQRVDEAGALSVKLIQNNRAFGDVADFATVNIYEGGMTTYRRMGIPQVKDKNQRAHVLIVITGYNAQEMPIQLSLSKTPAWEVPTGDIPVRIIGIECALHALDS
ncbi:hypothetical protein B0I35DRAFT_473479 [Stachybotrys elegans]|uniref:Rhodanese domain-containing protein n=1 Tax=Stachybotrys elegans TaxID=80388 RepID=A0A8K0T240_9HYPO|nr:hypothetical protein B0I35DRAFT_473479 [Stachybotrys elegans]